MLRNFRIPFIHRLGDYLAIDWGKTALCFSLLLLVKMSLASWDSPALHQVSPNLWTELRQGFKINHHSQQAEVVSQIAWFQAHPDHLKTVIQHASPYLYYITEAIKQKQLPTELALLPMVESIYDPAAISSQGAHGIWQLMPAAAARFGIHSSFWFDGRRDIVESTNAALKYFIFLDDHFHHDWLLALAAYHAGEGRVQRAILYNTQHHLPTSFWDLKTLPKSTQQYVPRLLAIAAIVDHPTTYHINWLPINNAPYLLIVPTNGQLDLSVAAHWANLSLDEIQRLNPGWQQWATGPYGPHRLILPIDHVQVFLDAMSKHPPNKRLIWSRHIVQPGECLGTIAHAYHISVSVLKQANHLQTNLIRQNQVLLVPHVEQTNNTGKATVHTHHGGHL